MDEGNVDVLARLKGPALAIFLAVGCGRGLATDELQTATGWGRTATYETLRSLSATGWMVRDRAGCWWLTPAGHAAMRELLRGWWEPQAGSGSPHGPAACSPERAGPESNTAPHRVGTAVPDNGSVVPGSNTDIHSLWTDVPDGGSAVPGSNTDIHSLWTDVPDDGSAVPGSNTDIHSLWTDVLDGGSAVPGSNTDGGRSVLQNGTAQSRGVPGNNTGPPHDHDHDDDQGDDESNPEIIIKALKAIKFDHPEPWLRQVDRRLVMPWVRYLEQNPGKHPNPVGYLRRCVENGDLPHERRSRRRVRDPCPECGRSFWSDTGDCLVCAGVIKC